MPAGIDPYRYRRKLLRNSPKNLAVLDAAAKKADWGCAAAARRVPRHRAQRGLRQLLRAGGRGFRRPPAACACIASLSAIDPGHVVNPLSIEMQTQGAVVYALTAALYGEITIKDGAAEQSNFDGYEMLRMADAPKVETVIVPSGGFWGGVGEPPVPPLAPALCNAIFAATGKRIRSLPLKNHDLRPVRTSAGGQ